MNKSAELAQSIEHLDFNPKCTSRRTQTSPQCGKDAKWASRAKCCGEVFFQCDSHVDGRGGSIECTCGAHFDSWREWRSALWEL